jgi:hypothetical protein
MLFSTKMPRLLALRWGVWAAAVAVLTFQLFFPPIVGLSDQGDFARIIGRFGYGPEDKSPIWDAFVKRKYVPDASGRYPTLEQPSSEYLFTGFAVASNKLISKDGKLDIRWMGLVHLAAFLAAFGYLLRTTAPLRTAPLIWIAALVVLTDVGYAAYWNSFFSEPASCIFLVLLIAESVSIWVRREASSRQLIRWSIWAALLVLAKAQNLPLALVLGPFCLVLARFRWAGIVGFCFVILAGIANLVTVPKSLKIAATYNVLFMSIVPESKTPDADLNALGLDPELVKFSGTGAWTPRTAMYDLARTGALGDRVTPGTVARFYLARPARMWRHARIMLPIAFLLRPEWCGNYERSAGHPPGARSYSFSLWSAFHERILGRAAKANVVLLLIAPFILIAMWIRFPERRSGLEFALLWAFSCLISLGAPVFGEAWDNVKHMFLFNLMIDTGLIWAVNLCVGLVFLQSNK